MMLRRQFLKLTGILLTYPSAFLRASVLPDGVAVFHDDVSTYFIGLGNRGHLVIESLVWNQTDARGPLSRCNPVCDFNDLTIDYGQLDPGKIAGWSEVVMVVDVGKIDLNEVGKLCLQMRQRGVDFIELWLLPPDYHRLGPLVTGCRPERLKKLLPSCCFSSCPELAGCVLSLQELA